MHNANTRCNVLKKLCFDIHAPSVFGVPPLKSTNLLFHMN